MLLALVALAILASGCVCAVAAERIGAPGFIGFIAGVVFPPLGPVALIYLLATPASPIVPDGDPVAANPAARALMGEALTVRQVAQRTGASRRHTAERLKTLAQHGVAVRTDSVWQLTDEGRRRIGVT